MTTEEIEVIRERAEKATEGPWDYSGEYFIGSRSEVVEVGEAYIDADADFIANAREDIPALLAEVERLKAKLSEAESLLSDAHDIMDDVYLNCSEVYGDISKYFEGVDK